MDYDDDNHRRKWILDASVRLASALTVNKGSDEFESAQALASYAAEIAGALFDLSEFA